MSIGKINVSRCPKCGDEGGGRYFRRCLDCGENYVMAVRDKKRISDGFVIVDWFSSRASAGLIVEDTEGNRYNIYMSDIFAHLNGMGLGQLTLVETKKGSAYGWRIIDEKEDDE